MNETTPELSNGTELELTYNGNHGTRTVTVYGVTHETSANLLDDEKIDHELVAAEPDARRPRFVRVAISNTESEDLLTVVEAGDWGVVKSLNSKSDRGRRLGRLEALDVTGETEGRFAHAAAVRGAVEGDVLLVDGERAVVTDDEVGTSVEFADGSAENLRTSPTEGACVLNDGYEYVPVAVEATGETVEAPEDAREAFEALQSYGHGDERKVVAVVLDGERHEVEFRHYADDEGIRFERESHGHDRLRLGPLGLAFEGERVSADDLTFVYEDEDEDAEESADTDGEGDEDAQGADEADADESDDTDLMTDGAGDECDLVTDGGETDLSTCGTGDVVRLDYRLTYRFGGASTPYRTVTVEVVLFSESAVEGEYLAVLTDTCRAALRGTEDSKAATEADGIHLDLDDPEAHPNVERVLGVRAEGTADADYEPFETDDDLVTDGGTEPQFGPGEAVEDRDGDGGTAYVVDADAGRAGAVEVGTTGVPVAQFDGNEDYPNDDRVVTVVYEGELDKKAPQWESWRENAEARVWFAEDIDHYRREWGVEIVTYDYPESRLVSVEDDDEGDADDDEGNGPDADLRDVEPHSAPEDLGPRENSREQVREDAEAMADLADAAADDEDAGADLLGEYTNTSTGRTFKAFNVSESGDVWARYDDGEEFTLPREAFAGNVEAGLFERVEGVRLARVCVECHERLGNEVGEFDADGRLVCSECGGEEPQPVTDGGASAWNPTPATLREGETTDERTHAARNAEMLRQAREELGRRDALDAERSRTERTRAYRLVNDAAPCGPQAGLDSFDVFGEVRAEVAGSVLLAAGEDLRYLAVEDDEDDDEPRLMTDGGEALNDLPDLSEGDGVAITYRPFSGGAGGGRPDEPRTVYCVAETVEDGYLWAVESERGRVLKVEPNAPNLLVAEDAEGNYRDVAIGDEVRVERMDEYQAGVSAFAGVRVEAANDEQAVERLNEALAALDRGDFHSLNIGYVEIDRGADGDRWEQAEARERGVDY